MTKNLFCHTFWSCSALSVMFENSSRNYPTLLQLSFISVCIAVLSYVCIFTSYTTSVSSSLYSPYIMELPTTVDSSSDIGLPVRLIIPKIDVDTKIQNVGLSQERSGEMSIPSNDTEVGWYKYGVRPGMGGSAVVAGHVSGRSVAEAVFHNLHTLAIGDEVLVVTANQARKIFRVVETRIYAHNDPTDEVFITSDGVVRLNLITCSGEWLVDEGIYNTRTVVFTEYVRTR